MAETDTYIAPWGRKLNVRDDVHAGCLPHSQGWLGSADKFVAWCDKIVAEFSFFVPEQRITVVS